MAFIIFIDNVQPSPQLNLEHHHHLKKASLYLLATMPVLPTTPVLPTQPWATTNLRSVSVDFSVLDSYMNGIRAHTIFCDCLFSLSILLSGFTHVLQSFIAK